MLIPRLKGVKDSRDLKICYFCLSVHWVNCAYPLSCIGRHPLAVEKRLVFSQNDISDHDLFLSTSVTEGE